MRWIVSELEIIAWDDGEREVCPQSLRQFRRAPAQLPRSRPSGGRFRLLRKFAFLRGQRFSQFCRRGDFLFILAKPRPIRLARSDGSIEGSGTSVTPRRLLSEK